MDSLQPPKTIEEMGIHLVYMSKNIAELASKFDAFQNNHVTINNFLTYQEIVNDRLKRLEDEHQAIQSWQDTWAGKVWGINATIGLLIGGILFIIQHYWK